MSRLSIQYQCIARRNPQLHQQRLTYRLIIIGDKSTLEPHALAKDTPLIGRVLTCEISIRFHSVTGRALKTSLSYGTILLFYISALGLITVAVTVNSSGECWPRENASKPLGAGAG